MEQIERKLRAGVIKTALAMSSAGLSPGRSGNVSTRHGGGMLITPTGMAYDVITPDDIVYVGKGGQTPDGAKAPSSEWRLHLAIYAAKPDAGAIVHCHSTSATAMACARRPIPAFHYMVAAAGGADIPLAPYATFGTPELARAIVATLKDRKGCLLANHGQIACGADLNDALNLAQEIESLAAQYIAALQLGEPHILSDDEMVRVLAKFETYGQQPEAAPSGPRRGRRAKTPA